MTKTKTKTKPEPRPAYVVDFKNHPELATVTVINETEQNYITDGKYTRILGFCGIAMSSRINRKPQVFFTLAEAVTWLRVQAQENIAQTRKELNMAATRRKPMRSCAS